MPDLRLPLDVMDISYLTDTTPEQPCLKSAMDAFSLVQMGSALQCPELSRAACMAYGRSLHHLRLTLDMLTEDTPLSSEVLVTIMILIICEVCLPRSISPRLRLTQAIEI